MLNLSPGQVVGGFEIKSKLGQGGMGAVYLAHDPRLKIDRALKVIALADALLDRVDKEEYRVRFFREAQTLARLRHSGIVAVHHVDTVDDNPYIVMDYFAGSDLRHWLYESSPSPEAVVAVGRQIAEALAYAHDNDVIHRDLKLSNILINDKGQVLLIDFGLAKSPDHDQLTKTGRSMGTFAYMAPEYVKAAMHGEKCEHTKLTDLWALGCIMYALATYKMAFKDADEMSLLGKIVRATYAPITDVRQDLADELVAVIGSLLEPDPQLRIPSAAELRRRLSAVRAARKPGVTPFVRPKPPEPSRGNSVFTGPTADARGGTENVAPSQLLESKSLAPEQSAPHLSTSHPGAPSEDASLLLPLPSVGVSVLAPPVKSPDAQPAPAPPHPSPQHPSPQRPVALADPASLSAFSAALAPPSGETSSPSAPSLPEVPHNPHAGGNAIDAIGGFLAFSEPPTPSLAAQPAFQVPAAPKKGNQKNAAIRNLALPALGALLVLGIGAVVISIAPAPSSEATSYVDPESIKSERSAESELRALEREKGQAGFAPRAPKGAPSKPPPIAPPVTDTPEPTATPTAAPVASTQKRRAKSGAAAPAKQPAPSPDDPWAARYGSRTSFNTTAVKKGDQTAEATGTPANAGAAGVRIPAKLDTTTASAPTGPVVAILTKATEIGGVTLPAGTQLHGTTRGTSGTRLLVGFHLAKTSTAQYSLRATALGSDGRAGIPAKKTLGGASDIGAGALQGAADKTGDMVADFVGDNPAGAAIRGGKSKAAAKSDRLNEADYVVEAKRGARFVVYIESFGS